MAVIRQLHNGLDKHDFVFGTDLDKVLFEGVSEIPDMGNARRRNWSRGRFIRQIENIVNKETVLPPFRVMRRNVTKQTDSDELFTGSFNPIQLAWYEGSIVF